MPSTPYNVLMTQAERERVVAYLLETRAALVESTRDLDQARWLHKPGPDQWSAAECVEHLSVTESSLCRVLLAMPDRPAASEIELAQAAGKEDLIVKAVPSRGRKVKGPEGAMPRLETDDPAAILGRFLSVRERTIEFARTTDHPLRTRLFPHFFFGPLDGFQWLIFMAAHSERHRRQIEEVKSAMNF